MRQYRNTVRTTIPFLSLKYLFTMADRIKAVQYADFRFLSPFSRFYTEASVTLHLRTSVLFPLFRDLYGSFLPGTLAYFRLFSPFPGFPRKSLSLFTFELPSFSPFSGIYTEVSCPAHLHTSVFLARFPVFYGSLSHSSPPDFRILSLFRTFYTEVFFSILLRTSVLLALVRRLGRNFLSMRPCRLPSLSSVFNIWNGSLDPRNRDFCCSSALYFFVFKIISKIVHFLLK